jgi:hypothetical protein
MMIIDDESLWTARRERARRFVQAGFELRGYPALSADDHNVDSDLSRLDGADDAHDAHECLCGRHQLPALRYHDATEAGRLLCVLLLRRRSVSADPTT